VKATLLLWADRANPVVWPVNLGGALVDDNGAVRRAGVDGDPEADRGGGADGQGAARRGVGPRAEAEDDLVVGGVELGLVVARAIGLRPGVRARRRL
jgi:hypothetical protein